MRLKLASYWKGIIILIFLNLNFSCNNDQKSKKEEKEFIEVELAMKTRNNPFGTVMVPFGLKEKIPPSFKLENRDSTFLYFLQTISNEALDSISKNQKYDRDLTEIHAISGLEDGSFFYILDKNNNNDFQDDVKYRYSKNLSNQINQNQSLLDSFPIIKMKIKRLKNGEFYNDKIVFRIFPDAHYFNYDDKNNIGEFKKNTQLIASIQDFYRGSFSFSGIKYKVFLDKYSQPDSPTLVIEPESVPFRYYSIPDRYLQNDTINIGSSYFTIDNVSLNPPKITLEKLKGNYFYGFRKGYLSKNYEIEDLVGKKTDFKNVLGEKKLLLLDFWGTWCKPCKDLTPDLVHLYKEYGENISFLSIAYDQNAMQVKDYVDKHQMSWQQAFIKKGSKMVLKPPLLENLRIKCYPTFILLDENLKIVFRECGNLNFKKLKDFLEGYKN